MAKKKGGKKSGKKGKKSGTKSSSAKEPLELPGGGDPSQMTPEELLGAMQRMADDMKMEKQDRNFFQMERDKIATFWEITKKQLQHVNYELRNKDREIEEAEERHQVEIKVYKQKVKHLLYEHQNNINKLKTDGIKTLKLEQQGHIEDEGKLRMQKRELAVTLKESELSHDDIIRNLKISHDQEISQLRQEFEREVKEIQQKYERKTRVFNEELELRRKNEVHETEERKNCQINTLMKNHEKAFDDIKNYYNDITLNNLALINSLKEQVEEMKKKEDRNEKQMTDIMAENKRLTEPLNKALAEVEECRRHLSNYEKDKVSLSNCKSRLKVQGEQLNALTWEHEVVQQRFAQVEKERDDLYDKFVKTIYDVQQKSGFQHLLLQKKVGALQDKMEKKDVRLNELTEVLSQSRMDPYALASTTRKLDEVLTGKNSAIKDLQYELARVCKAHNDVIKVYESKLNDHGIPAVDLGFKPLAMGFKQAPPGQGPAGLVSNFSY